MKVVHVLNHFMPDQIAGTEMYVWALGKQLEVYGINNFVLIPNYENIVDVRYKYDGLQIIKYAEPSVLSKELQMGFITPIGLNNFLSILDEIEPDVIHFHELAGSTGVGVGHLVSAKEKGFKVVMTFHLAGYTCKSNTLMFKGKHSCDGMINPKKCGYCYLNSKKNIKYLTPFLVESSWFLNLFNINPYLLKNKVGTAFSIVQQIEESRNRFYRLINHCDQVVVLTDWYKKSLLLNGVPFNKIKYIPQALISESLTVNKNGKKNSNSLLKMVFIGRIAEFKGLHLLLKALFELSNYSISLDIYGKSSDDHYEKECKRICSGNKLIIFKGVLNHSEVIDTLYQYDIMCLCSTFSEMSPLVIQEAFAARVPVIASNVKGNEEQIKHGINGLLFDLNNIESLKKQILRCIQEPELLDELKGNIFPPKSFSEVAIAYMKLYKQIHN